MPFRSYLTSLFKFWTLCVFEPAFGNLGVTYDVHLRLIGMRLMDFLSVLLEHTAEELRANID